MGTISDWVRVLLAGGFWGGWMAFWSAQRRGNTNLKPTWLKSDIFSWAFMGLWFGIVTTFHWHRAFHWPLVLITVASFAGAVFVGRIDHKSRTSGDPPLDS